MSNSLTFVSGVSDRGEKSKYLARRLCCRIATISAPAFTEVPFWNIEQDKQKRDNLFNDVHIKMLKKQCNFFNSPQPTANIIYTKEIFCVHI